MQSKSYLIIDDQATPDKQKVDALKNLIISTAQTLLVLRATLAQSSENLNAIMNANGDNPDEHYAKTMMLYGRKFCGADVIAGIADATDPRYQYTYYDKNHTKRTINYITPFSGIDAIYSAFAPGLVTIKWNCMTGMTGYYRTGKEPAKDELLQYHCLGTNVIMPTIKNLDNKGFGPGNNTYQLRSGFKINGWKLDPSYHTASSRTVYLLTDDGIAYKTVKYNGNTRKIQDERVFGFNDEKPPTADALNRAGDSSKEFKLPSTALSKLSGAYVGLDPAYPNELHFVLNVIPIWYEIQFIIRHGTADASSPVNTIITTTIGQKITLPAATLITMETGWIIDTDDNPYGTWTTVDPNTDATDFDPDYSTERVPVWKMATNTQVLVGSDMDPSIRKLYLKVKHV